jgi:hypothetical protein
MPHVLLFVNDQRSYIFSIIDYRFVMKVIDCLEVWKEDGDDCNSDHFSIILTKGTEVFKAESQRAFAIHQDIDVAALRCPLLPVLTEDLWPLLKDGLTLASYPVPDELTLEDIDEIHLLWQRICQGRDLYLQFLSEYGRSPHSDGTSVHNLHSMNLASQNPRRTSICRDQRCPPHSMVDSTKLMCGMTCRRRL